MKKKSSVWRTLMRLILFLALLGVLLLAAALGALCLAEGNPPAVTAESQAVIVLGCQVYPSGELSHQLELRLQAALDTYLAYPRLIIACGGQGQDEPAPEGRLMREWLIRQGVPPEDVIAECESQNTRQNLQFAKALLPENVRRGTIITSDYHLPRAMALAGDLGLTADGIGSPCLPEYWVKNHGREVLAWGKYLLQKITGQ